MQLISIFLKILWHLAVRWQICNQLNIPRVIVPSAGSWKMPETQKGLCLFMAWFCWNIKVQHGWLCGRGPHLELKEVGKGRLKTDDLAQRFQVSFSSLNWSRFFEGVISMNFSLKKNYRNVNRMWIKVYIITLKCLCAVWQRYLLLAY